MTTILTQVPSLNRRTNSLLSPGSGTFTDEEEGRRRSKDGRRSRVVRDTPFRGRRKMTPVDEEGSTDGRVLPGCEKRQDIEDRTRTLEYK